jgi:hypothetical protein
MKLSECQQTALHTLGSDEAELCITYAKNGKAEYWIRWWIILGWLSTPIRKSTFQFLLRNQYIYEKEKDIYVITYLGRLVLIQSGKR